MSVLVLPALVGSGARPGKQGVVPYGSKQELDLLDAYFRIPGAPVGKPYRAVWEESTGDAWRDDRYPGRSLQRIRTDRVKAGAGLLQVKSKPTDSWGLTDDAASQLAAYVGDPVRLVDLAIWYGRDREVEGLDDLVLWFEDTFPLREAGLVGTVYTEDVPAHYSDLPLAVEPLSQNDYAEALGAAPAPKPYVGELSSLVNDLEQALDREGFISPGGLVRDVVSGWLRGDLVILTGAPGTGKTKFADTIGRALAKNLDELSTTWIAVHPEFDQTDVIGYEQLDGTPHLREFARRVLTTADPLGTHLIVIEELNLAVVETYLAPILVALQDPERRVTLPDGQEVKLPVDAFFLATCNSYLEEPETRRRLSFPTKRRATIITMPNVVAGGYDKGGSEGVLELGLRMVAEERKRIEVRRQSGLATALDDLRLSALSTVSSLTDLSPTTVAAWNKIVSALLDTPEGRNFLTLGLIRDVILKLAMAERTEEAELAALSSAIEQKLIHQLRGPVGRGDELGEASSGLPTHAEILRLIDQMKRGYSDELISLL